MKRTIHLAILLALFFTTPARAYKEQIHRVLSLKAFDRMTAALKPHLGVDATVDLGGDSPRVLIGQGAYDEDDYPNSLNHFYDPVHEAPLSVPLDGCIPQGETAKNWAVGGLGNTFTTLNARQYYESALMAPNQAVRNNYLRLLFLSLGHSIHLVQDMAQPEHVRNDQHLTLYGAEFGYPMASLYEEWGIANLLGLNPIVPYDGYPNVKLPMAFDYFGSTANKGLAQFANNNFVTQDTNYDDEEELFHCHYYTLPRVGDAVPRTEVVNEAVADAFGGTTIMPIRERIYTSFPRDTYTGRAEVDPDHTFLSSLDLETRFLTGKPKYSLADASFQTRAGLLIPRAVGYSAGYLDHFFRGSMAVEWTRNDSTGRYNIKITNTSGESLGSDAIIRAVYVPGSAYTGFENGNDIAVILNGPLASYAPGFNGLAPGASTIIPAFSIPYLRSSDNVKKFERRVVIRGKLGSEPNDVIGLVQNPIVISKATYDVDCWSGGRCKLYAGSANELDFEEIPMTGSSWSRECTFDDTLGADATITAMNVNVRELYVANSWSDVERTAVKINGVQSPCCTAIQAGHIGVDTACHGNPTAYGFTMPSPSTVPYVKGGKNKLTISGFGTNTGTLMWLINAVVEVTYERPAP